MSAQVEGSFKARLTDTSESLTVNQFLDKPPVTPGNVGICLSGGGSRALSAGMGQLRALKHLQANGESLLSQAKALSTVSGGSWLGVTFEYLTSGTSDDAYLNQYVPDPGRLVPSKTSGHSQAETLDELPDGNIGNAVNTRLFSVPALAVEAYLLHKFFGTPANFLWQALMGLHILAPYGLYQPGDEALPTSLFSWDPDILKRDVTGPNPGLEGTPAHLVAGAGDPASDRTHRPYLLCNTAMFLNEPGTKIKYLAPVQATPFFTGIVGAPTGTDANGRTPGGGGVTSFAFSSNPTAVNAPDVTVSQQRQWAIADIVGASSAAFADTLQNLFAEWEQDPAKFFKLLEELADDIWNWLRKHLPGREEMGRVEDFLGASIAAVADLAQHAELKTDFAALSLKELIPEYQYWPVAGAQAYPETQATRFADGGSLENLGVADMLSYSDVDRIISFINTSIPLAPGNRGVIGPDGEEIPDTRVIVSSDIPPLFGYQPYQSGVGYVPYAGAENPNFPQGKNSQVFDSDNSKAFADLVKGLWKASGSGGYTGAALYKQTLEVKENTWFGVRGGRQVEVLWVHLSRVKAWYDLLSADVKKILGPFDDPGAFHNFPHYSTLSTDLDATEVNLLAQLTSWVVAAEENQGLFTELFQG